MQREILVRRASSSIMLTVLLITMATTAVLMPTVETDSWTSKTGLPKIQESAVESHDIAITNVIAVKNVVGQNYTALIMVAVENQGNFTETFNVTAYYSGTAISTEHWPDGGNSQTFWSMGDAVRDGYIDLWDADLIAYEYGWSGPLGKNPADINNDGKVDGKDVFACSKNFGKNIWTTLGIPKLIEDQRTVTLASGNLAILTFRWNTTGVAKGNYAISAYAWPVPEETDLADNSLADGSITVAMIGDIVGLAGPPDGKVHINDVAMVAAGFGVDVGADILAPGNGAITWLQYWHYPDCPTCPHNTNCDITSPEKTGVPDGKISIIDVATVAIRFGQEEP